MEDNKEDYPVLVIATSVESGIKYAQLLDLKKYKVVCSMRDTYGVLSKAVIVSPGYFMRVVSNINQAKALAEDVIVNSSITQTNMG